MIKQLLIPLAIFAATLGAARAQEGTAEPYDTPRWSLSTNLLS